MTIKERIAAALRSIGVRFNAALLIAFPFTDQIMQGVNDNLPGLAPYLPPDIYKWVGFVVVMGNIVRAAHSAAKHRSEP